MREYSCDTFGSYLFYSISMYFYDKNILEYTNIVVTESNYRILYTENHSCIKAKTNS